MKKYFSPELKITRFGTEETMSEYPSPAPESVLNIFDPAENRVQVGSIDFEKLK